MVEAHRQGRLVRRICDRVLVAVDGDRRSVGQERAARTSAVAPTTRSGISCSGTTASGGSTATARVVAGSAVAGSAVAGSVAPAACSAGRPGLFRLWNDAVGGQIAWLIPLGVAAAVAGVWLHRKRPSPARGRCDVRDVGGRLRRGVQLREGHVPQLLHERARAGPRCDHRHRWRRAGAVAQAELGVARPRRGRAARDDRRPARPHRPHPRVLRVDRGAAARRGGWRRVRCSLRRSLCSAAVPC